MFVCIFVVCVCVRTEILLPSGVSQETVKTRRLPEDGCTPTPCTSSGRSWPQNKHKSSVTLKCSLIQCAMMNSQPPCSSLTLSLCSLLLQGSGSGRVESSAKKKSLTYTLQPAVLYASSQSHRYTPCCAHIKGLKICLSSTGITVPLQAQLYLYLIRKKAGHWIQNSSFWSSYSCHVTALSLSLFR